MFAILFLALLTVTLFLYWFRYMCLLILKARTYRDYAGEIASLNRLRFPRLREELRALPTATPLAGYRAALAQEFDLVTYLLHHASSYEVRHQAAEMRMLMVDFRLMCAWYHATKHLSRWQARSALVEMCDVIRYIANTMGESSARTVEA